ncbi:MAG: ATP-binding protein [Chloroflexota bacterium]
MAIRYLSIATIFLIVTELIFGTFQIYTNYRQDITDLESKITIESGFLASVSAENLLNNNFLLLEKLMQQTNSDPDIIYAVIVHPEGNALTRYIDPENPFVATTLANLPVTPNALIDLVTILRENPLTREQRNIIHSDDNQEVLGEVWVGYSIAGVRQRLWASFLNTLLATLVINAVLVALTILLFNTMIQRPLLRMGRLTGRMADGDLSHRIPVSRFDEIGHLQESFNHMADNLAQTLSGLQNAKAEVDQSNEALHMSETEARKLSMVASLTSNAVIITDAKGQTEWVNQSFIDQNGYTQEEVLGRKQGELLSGPDTNLEALNKLRECVRSHQPCKTEILSYRKDGSAYWAKTDLQPVFNEEGVATNFIILRNDITERKESELQLQRAKEAAEAADRTKSNFLTNMSHEIRTPLNGIIGVSDMMLDADLPVEQQEQAKLIRQSGNSLLAIINDLLDFSTLDADILALNATPFTLQKCIDEALTLYRDDIKNKDLQLVVNIADTVPTTLIGDVARIQQVLSKLVGNALKFTEEGKITVAVQGHYVTDAPSTAKPQAKPKYRLEVAVQDSGIGIKPENQEAIFIPFTQVDGSHTRKRGGTGLGLTISQRIVQLMGGDMTVESELGRGSTFSFYVVVEAEPVVQPEQAKPKPKSKAQGGHRYDPSLAKRMPLSILIAEDNRVNQLVIMKMLKKMGYAPDIVDDGLQAVQAMKKQAQSDTPYDVILMDIQMPNLDGVAATQQIREYTHKQQDPYIVAVTAHAMEGDRERYLAAGMNNYVSKPVLAPKLINALEDAASVSVIV